MKIKCAGVVVFLFVAIGSQVFAAEEWLPAGNGILYDKSSVRVLGSAVNFMTKVPESPIGPGSVTINCQTARFTVKYPGDIAPRPDSDVLSSAFKELAMELCNPKKETTKKSATKKP